MKRILSISLFIIAVFSQVLAQAGREASATGFTSVAEVTSIPLSDDLAAKEKAFGESLKKGDRESTTQGAGSAGGQKPRAWASAEALFWRTKGTDLPPLLQRYSGFNSNTGEILVGGSEVNPGNAYGGRVTAGVWLNRSRTVGLEASYFYLGPRSINQVAGGNGEGNLAANPQDYSLILIRPYISTRSTAPLFLVSYPNYARGSLTASLSSHLQGAELNSVYDLGRRGCCGLRLIGGFRFLDLKERLTIVDAHVYNGVQFLGSFSDTAYLVTDEFRTRNRFYGAQGGVQTEFGRGRMRLELSAKVALGGVNQLVNIGGSTFVNRIYRNSTDLRVGGLLALETNIGRYERTVFAFLPEGKASVGYRLTNNLMAFAGYDFIYINRVARPAEQIDLVVDWQRVPFLYLTETPGPLGSSFRPAVLFSDSPFWAQGVTVGLRFGF